MIPDPLPVPLLRLQSQECLEKIAETMKYLAKDPETSPFMLVTGECISILILSGNSSFLL